MFYNDFVFGNLLQRECDSKQDLLDATVEENKSLEKLIREQSKQLNEQSEEISILKKLFINSWTIRFYSVLWFEINDYLNIYFALYSNISFLYYIDRISRYLEFLLIQRTIKALCNIEFYFKNTLFYIAIWKIDLKTPLQLSEILPT